MWTNPPRVCVGDGGRVLGIGTGFTAGGGRFFCTASSSAWPSGSQPAAAPQLQLLRQDQALHFPDDERRPQPGGHVRLQAGVAKVRQQVAAAGQKIHQLRRPPRRLPHAELAALPPGRPEWSARLRLFSECPPARRQAGGAQGVPRRQPCARLGAGCHEHRQHVHRAAVPRRMVRLRFGHRKPKPARLRGDARQTRWPDLRPTKLVLRLHALNISGHVVPAKRQPDPRPGRPGAPRRQSPATATRPAGQAQSKTPRRTPRRPGVGRTDSVVRTRLPHAGRGPRGRGFIP